MRDDEHSGGSVEVPTPETIEQIHDMVLADRRLKVREIVKAIGVSHGSMVSIMKDHLGMRKLSTRCGDLAHLKCRLSKAVVWHKRFVTYLRKRTPARRKPEATIT
ncbi:unnamed protein product [Acanthoscelides obtectus]|uniref:Uncharacterized protein n=1 Tax=Acanthoscelides obtectus TaxID=200917 RepID=A0A9P0P5J8_ACAOB|nr:unnamed protein product [Acanthoscelides obtectus]CAK1640387.1 hypothetical protein AOBTE_LOCUS11690 [Acanthoscelides obtectus]